MNARLMSRSGLHGCKWDRALSKAKLRSRPFKIEDASPRIGFQRDSNPLCSLDYDGGTPVKVGMHAPLMLRPRPVGAGLVGLRFLEALPDPRDDHRVRLPLAGPGADLGANLDRVDFVPALAQP